jgi:hypothetical protein
MPPLLGIMNGKVVSVPVRNDFRISGRPYAGNCSG